MFLRALFGRRYHNFSSDVILLLTGIGAVDEVFGVPPSQGCLADIEFRYLLGPINIAGFHRFIVLQSLLRNRNDPQKCRPSSSDCCLWGLSILTPFLLHVQRSLLVSGDIHLLQQIPQRHTTSIRPPGSIIDL